VNTDIQPSQDRDGSATFSSTFSAKDTNITNNVKTYYGSVLNTSIYWSQNNRCPNTQLKDSTNLYFRQFIGRR
jgi:hypothetical protein